MRSRVQRVELALHCCIVFRISAIVLLIGYRVMTLSKVQADKEILVLLDGLTGDNAKVVSVVEEVLKKLESQKLVYRARIHPRRVGVHPANRGGWGISVVEVHALGGEIIEMGWSMQATAHAVCVEDNASGDIAAFTCRLSSNTDGLGKVPPQEIKFGSLSCSHTNQFLVAVLCAVETEQEELVAVPGVDKRMSASKLSVDPNFKDALDNGLHWLVISSIAAQLYPNLCDLVQHARNKTGSVQRNETETQILYRIQNMASESSKANNGNVDWNHIKQIIMKRKGLSEDDFVPLLKFVQIYGGGDMGIFINDYKAFHESFVPSGRVIPTSTFTAIQDLKLRPQELCPFFMTAILKTQASCPASKAPRKVCRFVSSADISSLSSKKKQSMLASEKILKRGREIVEKQNLGPNARTMCLGRLDCRVVRFVLDKEKLYNSLEEIGDQFVTDVNEAASKQDPSHSLIASPWSSSASASSGTTGTCSLQQQMNIVQYDSDGNAVSAPKMSLQSAGCHLKHISTYMDRSI